MMLIYMADGTIIFWTCALERKDFLPSLPSLAMEIELWDLSQRSPP